MLGETLAAADIEQDPALVEQAVEAASVPAASRTTAGLAEESVDGRTLLHADHLGDPSGGGWRRWDPERLAALRPRLEPVLEEFGHAW